MSQLSPSTERLVADLRTLCSVRRVERPDARDARLAFLEQMFGDLGRCQEPELLLVTVFGLAHPEPRVVAAAAAAVDRLLAFWPAKQWPRLDQLLRRRWLEPLPSAVSDEQRRAEAEMVDRLPAAGSARVAGLIVMACHGNGFVRERAVDRLSESATVGSLAVLTLRLDDWVEVVRARAFDAWRGLLVLDHVEVVVEALPLIQRILAHQRVDTQRAWTLLAGLLESPAGHRALLRGLDDRRSAVARGALAAILKLDRPPEGWLPRALENHEAWIRFAAARALVRRGDLVALGDHLDALASDSFAPIRHLALDVCEERFPERLEILARRGLFDVSESVRRRCQERLVLKLDVDPLPIYRSSLEQGGSPSRCASVLLGLAETGDEYDRPAFEGHLTASTPRVRAAAVTGLGRLAEPTESEAFFGFLRDPAPRVIRAAEKALTRLPWCLQDLAAAHGVTASHVGRRALVELASRLSGWDRVIFLIDALRDPVPSVQRHAMRSVRAVLFDARGWVFSRPTPNQRSELEARLRFGAQSLGSELERQLRFVLRACGG